MTSRTGRINSDRAAGAFTLLELIAVLVLISTVLAIAAPSLRGFVRGWQPADAAAKVLALTKLARSQAISRGATHRLNIDAEQGAFWLTMQRKGAFVAIDGNLGQRFQLPLGVSISLVDSSGGEIENHVEFSPDGRCDPATVELAGGQRDVYWVTCDSPSARFRIITPDPEDRL